MKIIGEHAMVKTIKRRHVKRLLPGVRTQIVVRKNKYEYSINKAYSTAHTLAHLLFPKNFPEIIATGKKTPNLPHSNVVYSRRVRLDKESQKAIENYYAYFNKGHAPLIFNEYKDANAKEVESLTDSLYALTGIRANSSIMNVGKRGKEYVFFEISSIHFPLMEKYISSLPEKTSNQRLKKKQAVLLLETLKQQANGKIQVGPHF